MKLCWFIPEDSGGGVASVALSCCRQAAKEGHEVTLLLMAESTGWADEYSSDFQVEELNLCTEEERRHAPKVLVQWLERFPQDFLFFNRCLAADPALRYLPSSTYVCYTVHDTAPMYWKGALTHEDALDAVIAVSHTVKRQFRDKMTSPEKLSVLYNGTLLPSRPKITGRSDDIIFLGGHNPKKGAYDLLDLWPKLVNRGFGGRLHWFGNLETAFKKRIVGLQSADRIVTHGHVPRSVIFEEAACAKVLLMLSRVESFGMATIEGMGMGCLPVAWDIETGTSEIIAEGATGFVAPLGDTGKLADAVFTALSEHGEKADKAVEVARNKFSEHAMWQRYASFIEVLKKRPVEKRPKAEQTPPDFAPPIRLFQVLPEGLRNWIREFVGRSPYLGYWLRDLRGR